MKELIARLIIWAAKTLKHPSYIDPTLPGPILLDYREQRLYPWRIEMKVTVGITERHVRAMFAEKIANEIARAPEFSVNFSGVQSGQVIKWLP